MHRVPVILLLLFSAFSFAFPSAAEQQAPKETPKNSAPSATEAQNKKTAEQQSSKHKIRLPSDSEKQFNNDIKHYVKNADITPMLLGSDEFITLINEETTGTPKGVAILLSNWQQAATSPKAINFLRTSLPKQGWTTITIQSMTKPEHYPSVKDKTIAQNEENKETLTEYKNKLSKIITKVMAKAANYPGLFLVVAEGSNAALLVDLYQTKANKQPDVFVILSGHLLTKTDNKNYVEALASINVPILNLYLKYDNKDVLALAPQSLSESKKQLKVYYRQQQLNNHVSGYYPHKALLTAINGWLKHIGW